MAYVGEILAQSGTITTTTTTADQIVLSYTVPPGKTLLLSYCIIQARNTVMPGNPNPILLGTASLESPAGTKLYTLEFVGNILTNVPLSMPPSVIWQIPSGTTLQVTCTPAATTSTVWRANFGGVLQ